MGYLLVAILIFYNICCVTGQFRAFIDQEEESRHRTWLNLSISQATGAGYVRDCLDFYPEPKPGGYMSSISGEVIEREKKQFTLNERPDKDDIIYKDMRRCSALCNDYEACIGFDLKYEQQITRANYINKVQIREYTIELTCFSFRAAVEGFHSDENYFTAMRVRECKAATSVGPCKEVWIPRPKVGAQGGAFRGCNHKICCKEACSKLANLCYGITFTRINLCYIWTSPLDEENDKEDGDETYEHAYECNVRLERSSTTWMALSVSMVNGAGYVRDCVDSYPEGRIGGFRTINRKYHMIHKGYYYNEPSSEMPNNATFERYVNYCADDCNDKDRCIGFDYYVYVNVTNLKYQLKPACFTFGAFSDVFVRNRNASSYLRLRECTIATPYGACTDGWIRRREVGAQGGNAFKECNNKECCQKACRNLANLCHGYTFTSADWCYIWTKPLVAEGEIGDGDETYEHVYHCFVQEVDLSAIFSVDKVTEAVDFKECVDFYHEEGLGRTAKPDAYINNTKSSAEIEGNDLNSMYNLKFNTCKNLCYSNSACIGFDFYHEPHLGERFVAESSMARRVFKYVSECITFRAKTGFVESYGGILWRTFWRQRRCDLATHYEPCKEVWIARPDIGPPVGKGSMVACIGKGCCHERCRSLSTLCHGYTIRKKHGCYIWTRRLEAELDVEPGDATVQHAYECKILQAKAIGGNEENGGDSIKSYPRCSCMVILSGILVTKYLYRLGY